jgi:hypothetical protein
MLTFLKVIEEEMEKNNQSYEDEGFKAKEEELKEIRKNVSPIHGQIYSDVEVIINSTDDKLPLSGIKKLLKMVEEKETTVTLEDALGYFTELEKHVKLSEREEEIKKLLNDAISDPTKFKDKPQEKEIDLTELKTIPVFANADDNLLKKWRDLPDSNGKYKKKSAIEKLINRVIGDATKKGKFVEHIKDDSNATGTSDDEKLGNFFTKTDPKKVIETILTHEKLDTDDKKNAEKKKVKEWSEGSGDGKKALDMTKYGSDKKDGEPNDDGVLKFLYEVEIGAGHQTRDVSEQEQGGNGDGEKETGILNHLSNNW